MVGPNHRTLRQYSMQFACSDKTTDKGNHTHSQSQHTRCTRERGVEIDRMIVGIDADGCQRQNAHECGGCTTDSIE